MIASGGCSAYTYCMRLSALQTNSGFYHLFEVPSVVSLAVAVGLDLGVPENKEYLEKIGAQILQAAWAEASGILVEPTVGLQAFLDQTSPLGRSAAATAPIPGLVLRLDVPNLQALPGDLPEFSPDWGVEHIRNNYGVAFLQLTYDPSEAKALEKKQIVGEIGDFCLSQDIDFIVDLKIPVSVDDPDSLASFTQRQLTAVQELRSACQMLVLQAASDPLTEATLTAELDIPWLVWGGDQPFDQLTDVVRQAMDNGAVGCLVSNSIWQDLRNLRRADQGIDDEQMGSFLTQELPQRFQKLDQIISETVKVS